MTAIDFSSDFGKRTLARLHDERVIWLTTTSPSNTPQPNPVWFILDNDAVLIYSLPDTGKTRGVQRNANVSLNFNSTAEGGDVAVFRGTATLDSDAPPANEHAAFVEKYSQSIQHMDMTPESFATQYSQAIRVTLEHLHGF